MTVSQQIQELISVGMTQELIAEKAGIKTQSKISRIVTGATKHPRHCDAKAIEELHEFVICKGNEWTLYDTPVAVEG